MDNQGETAVRAELEAEAAEMMGEAVSQPQTTTEETESTTESTSEETVESASEESGTEEVTTEAEPPQFTFSDEEKALVEEVRKLTGIDGTPFKTVGSLKDGYKNLQSQYTKLNERIKAVAPILERLETDQQYRQYAEQLQALMDNPSLRQSLAAQITPQDLEPDPLAYGDIQNDPDAYKRFKSDHAQWVQRQVHTTIQTELGSIREGERMRSMAAEFRTKFPDVENPDEVLNWAKQNVPRMNPYEAAYRLREFESLPAKLEAKIRADVLEKVKKAGETTTPASTAPPAKKISAEDVLRAVDTLGLEGAKKKFGKDRVLEALRKDAEQLMRM